MVKKYRDKILQIAMEAYRRKHGTSSDEDDSGLELVRTFDSNFKVNEERSLKLSAEENTTVIVVEPVKQFPDVWFEYCMFMSERRCRILRDKREYISRYTMQDDHNRAYAMYQNFEKFMQGEPRIQTRNRDIDLER